MKLFLRVAGWSLLMTLVLNAAPMRAATVINPLSQFAITVDGRFTGGITNGHINPMTEWSDITPLAFISPPNNVSGPAVPVALGDPRAK